jgi:hypothetical protein
MLIIAFVFALLPLHAQETQKANENNEDLATLQQLLKMPKDDLKRVRLTLESIEKMSPSDRKKALQRIQDLNKMPTKQRKETIDRWNELSPELKKDYFDYLRKLSASERTKFKALPWDKQIEEVKKKTKK